jgi:hypothetical protein
MQDAVSDSAAVPITEREGRGNAGAVESLEKQKRLFHPSHRPLEISQTPRDSHIPTARLRGPEKVENQKQVFHFLTAARDEDPCLFLQSEKTKNAERKSARYAGLLILLSPLPPVEPNRFHAHPSIGKC